MKLIHHEVLEGHEEEFHAYRTKRLMPSFKSFHVEIDKQAYADTGQLQVGHELSLVDREDLADALQLDNQSFIRT